MPPMRRTSILLDPGLLAELERIAQRQGRPTAHVIREALERYASEAREQGASLPAFIGLGNAGGAGASTEEPPGSAEGDDAVDSTR